jgi:nucleoside-diphosphate-sugar epimerase
VAVVHRGQTHADLPASVRLLRADRSDLPSFIDATRHLAPDVVVDMIALTEAHAGATLAAFRAAGRIVTISSMDVYRAFGIFLGSEAGPAVPVPIDEGGELRATLYPLRHVGGDPPPADRPFDYEKILVERVMREQSDVPATVLRLPIVYGPGDTARRRTLPYVKRMSDRRPAILLSRSLSGWVASRGYVENVACGIADAVMNLRAANQTYNIADQRALSERQWVERLADACGWRGRIVEIPHESVPSALRLQGNLAQHLLLDTSRIREELGYRERVSLEESIRRTVAWDLANPPADLPADMPPYGEEDAVLATLDRARMAHRADDAGSEG